MTARQEASRPRAGGAAPARGTPTAIAIGGSAGAVEALLDLLPPVPATLAIPVVLVVHVPAGAGHGLVDVLAGRCRLRVLEAEDKMAMDAGTVYVAPPDYHLLMERGGTLALSADPPVHFSRPSIDVLFESAAHAFGAGALGVLLSGANADGAAGLATIKRRGGRTWVQAPDTARMAAMPREALARTDHPTLTIDEMRRILTEWGYAGA
jgi:two-component system chemotaxis response regulator CheB